MTTKRSAVRAALVALGLVLSTASGAGAAPLDEANLEGTVAAVTRSGDPIALAELLQDLSARAERAAKKGDHAAAARYWLATTQAVPERAYGFGRLCDALEANGQREPALVACRTAVTRQGTTAGDYTHFVKLLLAQEAPLSPSDRRQVDVAIAALAKEPAAALITERVRCNVATHEHDVGALEACTAKLVAAAPGDARTLAFEWALALEKHDLAAAERVRARALAAGLDAPSSAKLDGTAKGASSSRLVRFVVWAGLGLGAALALVFVYAVATRLLAARRRQAAA